MLRVVVLAAEKLMQRIRGLSAERHAELNATLIAIRDGGAK
jgi:hypothetical protein